MLHLIPLYFNFLKNNILDFFSETLNSVFQAESSTNFVKKSTLNLSLLRVFKNLGAAFRNTNLGKCCNTSRP